MHEEEIIDSLDLIVESAKLVRERFSKVGAPDDFVRTPEGVTLLDAITMRLQVIGESVKKIQKNDPSFLLNYSEIEWEKISRFRDLVSHHYSHVDHEIVYDICKSHIPRLIEIAERMRVSLSDSF
jgi:uncharacterized protein with HEPN domain